MRGRAFGHGRGRAALLALASLPGLAVSQVTAQPISVEAEMKRCRAISDRQARFECYDAIVLPAAAPASRGAPVAGAAPAGPVVGATAVPAAGTVGASAPTAPGAAGTSAHQHREFGLPERPVSALVQSIDSFIEGPFDGWVAGARLRLANGQVWEIVDGSSASYQLRDPKVRVSRGLLGSFFISIEGVAQSPRVRRIQ